MHCISQFPAVLQLLDAHCSCFKFRPGSRLEFLHHLASEANPARRIRGFSTELLSLLGSPATKRLQLLWMAWVGTCFFSKGTTRKKTWHMNWHNGGFILNYFDIFWPMPKYQKYVMFNMRVVVSADAIAVNSFHAESLLGSNPFGRLIPDPKMDGCLEPFGAITLKDFKAVSKWSWNMWWIYIYMDIWFIPK